MKKSVYTLLLLLAILTSHLFANVNPAWYKVTFQQYSWLSNNSTDIQWQGYGEKPYGRLDIIRSTTYEQDASSAGVTDGSLWTNAHKDLTFVITTTDPSFILTNTEDHTKQIGVDYLVRYGANQYTSDIFSGTMNHSLGLSIDLNFTLPSSNTIDYEGSYTASFHLQIFAEYGTENQVLIDENTYYVAVFYKNKTNPNQQGFTNLDVVKYNVADNIDANYLMQQGNKTTIGSVTFTSNIKKKNRNYSIKISPKIDPLTGKFSFTHTQYNSTIFYEVYVPGRTNPQDRAFSVSVPRPHGNANWGDFFELAITRFSMQSGDLLAGEYTSTIIIELESD